MPKKRMKKAAVISTEGDSKKQDGLKPVEMFAIVKRDEVAPSIVSDKNGSIVFQSKSSEVAVKKMLVSFMEMAGTTTGQSTYYDSKGGQQKAIMDLHDGLMGANRGLYAALLAFPGVNDIHKQLGLMRLLGCGFGSDKSLLTLDQESRLIEYLAEGLPIPRLLKTFGHMRTNKINNSRTRRLILSAILNGGSLEFWSVKYRRKLKSAIVHAIGGARASALRTILSKADQVTTDKEREFFDYCIGRHVRSQALRKSAMLKECICFILGGNPENGYTTDLIRRYYGARADLDSGKGLPRETLEGIRGSYHKDEPKGKILELSKQTMSETDKMRSQSAAAKAGVEIEFDPSKQDIVSLFVYALEKGMTDRISKAISKKAGEIARSLPLSYDKVGVVLDASMSMFGTSEAKRRPMAIALAMRDILTSMAKNGSFESVAGGAPGERGLVYPQGDTSLAESVLDVAEKDVDAMFIITDGYENAPAGRVNEVIKAMRGMGRNMPIYQVTSVIGSETGGVRMLSDELIPMPVSKPSGVGLAMVRAAIDADLPQGIKALIGLAKPLIEGGKGDE